MYSKAKTWGCISLSLKDIGGDVLLNLPNLGQQVGDVYQVTLLTTD